MYGQEYTWSPFAGQEPRKYGLTLVMGPANEPVSLAEQKTHSRVDITADDTYISALITAARAYAENYLGRRIITQTWDLTLDQFPWPFYLIRMPFGPIQSITSITYVALDGTQVVWPASNYNLDSASFEPRIFVSYSQVYPVPRWIPNAVVIRFVAGATLARENIKHAIKMIVDDWYTVNRSDTTELKVMPVPRGATALLAQERQSWI